MMSNHLLQMALVNFCTFRVAQGRNQPFHLRILCYHLLHLRMYPFHLVPRVMRIQQIKCALLARRYRSPSLTSISFEGQWGTPFSAWILPLAFHPPQALLLRLELQMPPLTRQE